MFSMKVLFVCRHNTGRSQIAKALYNGLTHTTNAESAGTHVKEIGQTLEQRRVTIDAKNFFLFDVMNEVGYDIAAYVRTPISEHMLEEYDKIVSMADKEDTPEWLLRSSKYEFWDVMDPRGQDYSTTVRVRDEIQSKVKKLIAQSSD
jgi:arsenate reductase (thioredoxin)